MGALIRRAFTGATLTGVLTVALVAGGTLPAHALNSTFCPHSSSTRYFTANDGEYKLWLKNYYYGTNGFRTTYVCFAASTAAAGVISVSSPVGNKPVAVTPMTFDPDCPELLHVQDPQEFMTRLMVGLSPPYYLCFGAYDQSFRVTIETPAFSAGNTDIHLYLDAGTTLHQVFCTAAPTQAQCANGTDVSINIY